MRFFSSKSSLFLLTDRTVAAAAAAADVDTNPTTLYHIQTVGEPRILAESRPLVNISSAASDQQQQQEPVFQTVRTNSKLGKIAASDANNSIWMFQFCSLPDCTSSWNLDFVIENDENDPEMDFEFGMVEDDVVLIVLSRRTGKTKVVSISDGKIICESGIPESDPEDNRCHLFCLHNSWIIRTNNEMKLELAQLKKEAKALAYQEMEVSPRWRHEWGDVTCMDYSSHRERLALGCKNGKIIFWDHHDVMQQQAAVVGLPDMCLVNCLCWGSSDSNEVIVGCSIVGNDNEGLILVVSAAREHENNSIVKKIAVNGPVLSLAMDRSGTRGAASIKTGAKVQIVMFPLYLKESTSGKAISVANTIVAAASKNVVVMQRLGFPHWTPKFQKKHEPNDGDDDGDRRMVQFGDHDVDSRPASTKEVIRMDGGGDGFIAATVQDTSSKEVVVLVYKLGELVAKRKLHDFGDPYFHCISAVCVSNTHLVVAQSRFLHIWPHMDHYGALYKVLDVENQVVLPSGEESMKQMVQADPSCLIPDFEVKHVLLSPSIMAVIRGGSNMQGMVEWYSLLSMSILTIVALEANIISECSLSCSGHAVGIIDSARSLHLLKSKHGVIRGTLRVEPISKRVMTNVRSMVWAQDDDNMFAVLTDSRWLIWKNGETHVCPRPQYGGSLISLVKGVASCTRVFDVAVGLLSPHIQNIEIFESRFADVSVVHAPALCCKRRSSSLEIAPANRVRFLEDNKESLLTLSPAERDVMSAMMGHVKIAASFCAPLQIRISPSPFVAAAFASNGEAPMPLPLLHRISAQVVPHLRKYCREWGVDLVMDWSWLLFGKAHTSSGYSAPVTLDAALLNDAINVLTSYNHKIEASNLLKAYFHHPEQHSKNLVQALKGRAVSAHAFEAIVIASRYNAANVRSPDRYARALSDCWDSGDTTTTIDQHHYHGGGLISVARPMRLGLCCKSATDDGDDDDENNNNNNDNNNNNNDNNNNNNDNNNNNNDNNSNSNDNSNDMDGDKSRSKTYFMAEDDTSAVIAHASEAAFVQALQQHLEQKIYERCCEWVHHVGVGPKCQHPILAEVAFHSKIAQVRYRASNSAAVKGNLTDQKLELEDKIRQYLASSGPSQFRPLLVIGQPGWDATDVLSRVAVMYPTNADTVVVLRYLKKSVGSASPNRLIDSICTQLNYAHGTAMVDEISKRTKSWLPCPVTENEQDDAEPIMLCQKLLQVLNMSSEKKKTVLILDGLDGVEKGSLSWIQWIPPVLPAWCRMVISVHADSVEASSFGLSLGNFGKPMPEVNVPSLMVRTPMFIGSSMNAEMEKYLDSIILAKLKRKGVDGLFGRNASKYIASFWQQQPERILTPLDIDLCCSILEWRQNEANVMEIQQQQQQHQQQHHKKAIEVSKRLDSMHVSSIFAAKVLPNTKELAMIWLGLVAEVHGRVLTDAVFGLMGTAQYGLSRKELEDLVRMLSVLEADCSKSPISPGSPGHDSLTVNSKGKRKAVGPWWLDRLLRDLDDHLCCVRCNSAFMYTAESTLLNWAHETVKEAALERGRMAMASLVHNDNGSQYLLDFDESNLLCGILAGYFSDGKWGVNVGLDALLGETHDLTSERCLQELPKALTANMVWYQQYLKLISQVPEESEEATEKPPLDDKLYQSPVPTRLTKQLSGSMRSPLMFSKSSFIYSPASAPSSNSPYRGRRVKNGQFLLRTAAQTSWELLGHGQPDRALAALHWDSDQIQHPLRGSLIRNRRAVQLRMLIGAVAALLTKKPRAAMILFSRCYRMHIDSRLSAWSMAWLGLLGLHLPHLAVVPIEAALRDSLHQIVEADCPAMAGTVSAALGLYLQQKKNMQEGESYLNQAVSYRVDTVGESHSHTESLKTLIRNSKISILLSRRYYESFVEEDDEILDLLKEVGAEHPRMQTILRNHEYEERFVSSRIAEHVLWDVIITKTFDKIEAKAKTKASIRGKGMMKRVVEIVVESVDRYHMARIVGKQMALDLVDMSVAASRRKDTSVMVRSLLMETVMVGLNAGIDAVHHADLRRRQEADLMRRRLRREIRGFAGDVKVWVEEMVLNAANISTRNEIVRRETCEQVMAGITAAVQKNMARAESVRVAAETMEMIFKTGAELALVQEHKQALEMAGEVIQISLKGIHPIVLAQVRKEAIEQSEQVVADILDIASDLILTIENQRRKKARRISMGAVLEVVELVLTNVAEYIGVQVFKEEKQRLLRSSPLAVNEVMALSAPVLASSSMALLADQRKKNRWHSPWGPINHRHGDTSMLQDMEAPELEASDVQFIWSPNSDVLQLNPILNPPLDAEPIRPELDQDSADSVLNKWKSLEKKSWDFSPDEQTMNKASIKKFSFLKKRTEGLLYGTGHSNNSNSRTPPQYLQLPPARPPTHQSLTMLVADRYPVSSLSDTLVEDEAAALNLPKPIAVRAKQQLVWN